MIHEALASALNECGGWNYGYVSADDIATAEFRRGGGEVEVTFEADVTTDHPYITTKIIPAEGVLTALLRKALESER